MATAAKYEDVRTVSADQARLFQDGSIAKMGKGRGQCYKVDTDMGCVFWSYSSCIAVVDHSKKVISFNMTRYSATTNRYQGMLRHTLPAMYTGYWVFESDPGVFNITPDALVQLARGDQPDTLPGDTVEDMVDKGMLPEHRSIARSHIEYNRYGFGYVKRSRSTLI